MAPMSINQVIRSLKYDKPSFQERLDMATALEAAVEVHGTALRQSHADGDAVGYARAATWHQIDKYKALAEFEWVLARAKNRQCRVIAQASGYWISDEGDEIDPTVWNPVEFMLLPK